MFNIFRRKELPDEPYIEPYVVGRTLKREWSDDSAGYVYKLTESSAFTPHLQVTKMFLGVPVGKSRYVNGEPSILSSCIWGNLTWAKRIAKRYKLKIEQGED